MGDYEVLNEIARGSMGVVLRGRHDSGGLVAIKRLQTRGRLDESDLLRFRQEGETTRRLRHPHIVPLLDAGSDAQGPYQVLELVEGQTLKDLIARQGRLDARQVADLGRSLAGALDHAHQHGVIHRDIKPANILLDARGQARLTDFGLAKVLDLAHSMTASGEILGTPMFMAPEQVRADKHLVGPATDIYGLGATLYQALTGATPIDGPNVHAVLGNVLHVTPPPPSKLVPGVDPQLERIVLRCLEKEPGQRFGSAAELEQAFAEWLEPPLPATGSATISRPTATPVVLALSFVLVGVAVAILLVASTRRPAGSIAREPAAPRPPDPAAASDPPVDVDPLARASPTPEPTPLRHPDPRVHRLLELVAEPDSGELAEAALLAAKLTIRPQLDVEAELRRLDRAAEGLRLQLANMRGTDRATALFQVVLRHVVRLAPQTSYGDPRNSCLDHVLESGEGIEITCALLLIALGERLDVPLQGACFPGSFMVLTPPPNSLVISFRNEQIELRTRVDAALVQRGQSTSLLDPAPRQLILVRLVHFMAQNLEAHGKRADARRAFELVQLLAPERTDAVIMRCYGGQ